MYMEREIKDYINLLYEDNHIIAAVKPPNVPSQGDITGDVSFFDSVKDYIKIKYNKRGNVFLGLVHRLDRPVSGAMVFAKTSKAASRLSEAIRDRKFDKTYYAIVNGILLDREGELENYLIKKKNKLGNIAQVVFENTKNSKLAKLKYNVLKEDIIKNMSLIKIYLETGRFHQIRVQLANIGHTIYGDRKYGNYIRYDRDDMPLALFAKSLKFPHPTRDEEIFIDADLPNYNPWNMFL
ncbi:RluA family pseudouridine synthase [uncultured Brachyspira sp.]|uniref:RluA family pseudouridine synthase n=1 Tax=uncultured Brachyspira sp. TaxID=221953 RepID=UPI0025CDF181|nr:RluA family pseudouridine synthase [uncultured Brachyspira sp.]